MVEFILSWLGVDGSPLAQNLLLRVGCAAITAFVVTVLGTRWLLRILVRVGATERVDKTDSEKLADLHKSKSSTPTMGGVALVAGLLAGTCLWSLPSNPYIQTGILLVLGFAGLGFLDDWTKLKREGRKGMTIRGKLAWQSLLGLSCALSLYLLGREADGSVVVAMPVLRSLQFTLPAGIFLVFATLVLVTTVNAVNFTDGLDGLASGCAVITGIPLAAVAYLAGSGDLAAGIGIPFVEGAGELSVFGGALIGCGLGFLWHNCFPAQLFMGDTGSLALGAGIGYIAIAVKQELLLPIVGAVFVAEGLSVLLQVLSFRLTGKRLFLIAPLHHRYQFLGWPETQITIRFWISAVVSATAGAVALKM
ncbi:MAG: phospho-N-acetylmuramoyl-pentapeptide-transferase [Planctomycetota bacterium]|jgi:phospho-N-acetylmuramoyl-pentapeptide-transferase